MLRLCHLLGHTKNHTYIATYIFSGWMMVVLGRVLAKRCHGNRASWEQRGPKEESCQEIPVGIVDRRVAILSLRLEGDFIKFSAQEMLWVLCRRLWFRFAAIFGSHCHFRSTVLHISRVNRVRPVGEKVRQAYGRRITIKFIKFQLIPLIEAEICVSFDLFW